MVAGPAVHGPLQRAGKIGAIPPDLTDEATETPVLRGLFDRGAFAEADGLGYLEASGILPPDIPVLVVFYRAEETGGTTFAVQYKALSQEALKAYYREDAARLRADSLERFGDKCLAFRTELEILSEH